MAAIRRHVEAIVSPLRHNAHPAAVRATYVIGHASYRVRQASASTMPAMAERLPSRTYAISSATASNVSASSSGSVIGVACRYTTFGFSAKTAAPTSAAAAEPVSAPAIQAMAVVATANEITEMNTADAPVW